ncbi:DUF4113 domain-containing protein [Chromobacterium haemolyticum]|uniref:DUF4113 domain-containing protein n=1 Tax=Chromobacterium haemolyticum TaxID=394935 RepID=UPI0038CC0D91
MSAGLLAWTVCFHVLRRRTGSSWVCLGQGAGQIMPEREVSGSPLTADWHMRQELRSPCLTTKINELLSI